MKLDKTLKDLVFIHDQEPLHEYVHTHYNFKKHLTKNKTMFSLLKSKRPDRPLIVCHSDTVHKDPVSETHISDSQELSSPQGIGGDDRAGIWHMLRLLKKRLDVNYLICSDEEIGGVGASYFAEYASRENLTYPFIIELDRKGTNDAVFYSCGNEEFKKVIEKTNYFKEAFGSFSDISIICPELNVAGVNLSTGVDFCHTPQEVIYLSKLEEINYQIHLLILSLMSEGKFFDFQEETYDFLDFFWRERN